MPRRQEELRQPHLEMPLSPSVVKTIHDAQALAFQSGHPKIMLGHIFKSLIRQPLTREVLNDLKVNPESLKPENLQLEPIDHERLVPHPADIPLDKNVLNLIDSLIKKAAKKPVEEIDLLLAMLEDPTNIPGAILRKNGITLEKKGRIEYLFWLHGDPEMRQR